MAFSNFTVPLAEEQFGLTVTTMPPSFQAASDAITNCGTFCR